MSTERRIIGAALRVFEEHGFRGTTTRRIAEVAGVNEVTIFRRFGTKERLLVEACRWWADQHPVPPLPTAPVDPEAELVDWCVDRMRAIYEARALLVVGLAHTGELPEIGERTSDRPARVAEELTTYLLALQAQGLARSDVDAGTAANLLMGAMFAEAIVRDELPARFPTTLDESVRSYVHLLVLAIGADGGPPCEA